jgi:hypothetical protein
MRDPAARRNRLIQRAAIYRLVIQAMTPTQINMQAERVAQHVRSLPDFVFYDFIEGNNFYIGATVADADEAGLPPHHYQDVQAIINATADIFISEGKVKSRAHFDHSIWQYVRKKWGGSDILLV